MHCPRRKGFSLLEAICTIFVFAVILAAVSSLMTSISKVSRRADELSWKTTALAMLRQIELDAHRAYATDLASPATANQIEFQIRDTQSVEFLPDSPPTGWSLDAPALELRIVYDISNERLTRTQTNSLSAVENQVFGTADEVFFERELDGNFLVEVRNGKDRMRKEFQSFSLRSLAAPL